MAHVRGNAFKTLVSQLQAVVQRILLVHTAQVSSIGGKKKFLFFHNSISHLEQYPIPYLVAYRCKFIGSSDKCVGTL